jgi:hypothetical protein
MDAEEFDAWRQFHQVEPFGGEGEDLRLSYQVCRTLQAWGANLSPADCRPSWGGSAEQRREPVMVDFQTGIKMLMR